MSCPWLHGNPHLKLLPELHIAFFVSFWDGHVVVFTFFLVEQFVPSKTGRREGKGQAMALHLEPLVRLLERCLYRDHGRGGGGGVSLASSRLLSAAWGLESLLDLPYHPLAGIFISSETPKEREPMKSFRVVRSQSQISTDSRRSLSEGFNLLQKNKHVHNTLSCLHRGILGNTNMPTVCA